MKITPNTSKNEPFINLDIFPRAGDVPAGMPQANSGVTRWGDLLLRLAMEEHGLRPKHIRGALKAGKLSVHTSFVLRANPTRSEGGFFIGTFGEGQEFHNGQLEAVRSTLTVAGGNTNRWHSSIDFVRNEGMYVPAETSKGLGMRIAVALGNLEELVTSHTEVLGTDKSGVIALGGLRVRASV